MTAQTRHTVGIIGAGTMGAGIAQVAATHGWTAYLMDTDDAITRRAIDEVKSRLDRLVEKGRMTKEERDDAAARLLIADAPGDFEECELLIEAVIEDLRTKAIVILDLLTSLRDDCIIATNTSSLSISELGKKIGQPHRTVGMHFFNPAPLMQLVEVIAGRETDRPVVNRVAKIAESWGKKVARAADAPGFIVNHVARPYYLEAFRILEDGYAQPAEIDDAMRRLGGFRMGPLELTDLIGQDVNAATTRSVWEQLGKPPLLAPSRLQEQLVEKEHLGRKTNRGVYRYEAGMAKPAFTPDHRELIIDPALEQAMNNFTSRAAEKSGTEFDRYIFARILIAVLAQAWLAFQRGVASKDDIDIAMQYGVNYPRGPFVWAGRIGIDRCNELLVELNETVDDNRFDVTLV